MKRKPKSYDYEPDVDPVEINGTGQYQRIGSVSKSKMTTQIGFVRQQKPTQGIQSPKRVRSKGK